MNSFQEWANDFMVRFNWLGEQAAESQSLREDFAATFSGFSVDVLKKATREIALLDPQPRTNEIMPKLLARCRSLSFVPRSHNLNDDPLKEPRYCCLQCRDLGYIEVYHPLAYTPIRAGCFEASKHFRYLIVACTCDEGVAINTRRESSKSSPLLRFNPIKMMQVKAARTSDQIAELTEFVTNRSVKFSGFESYQ
jgi:hypothetical protein